MPGIVLSHETLRKFLFVEQTLWPIADCKSFWENISKTGSVADKRFQAAVVHHKSNAIEKSFGCFCDNILKGKLEIKLVTLMIVS